MNLSRLFTSHDIKEAFQRLKRKRFKKGLEEFSRFSQRKSDALNGLGRYLKSTDRQKYYSNLKDFQFFPYQGIKIQKGKDKQGRIKYRPLLVPQAKDRIVLAAAFPKIRNLLKKELARYLALGLGLGAQEDISECQKTLSDIKNQLKENRYVLKLDFKDFFSTIDRKILLKKLKPFFKSKNDQLFRLIKKSISNSIEANPDFWGTFQHLDLRRKGIPQGLSYSPLLASFYALSLDKVSDKVKGCKSYRYLDDMIVLAKNEKVIKQAYKFINKESKKIKLILHPLQKEGSKTKSVDIESEQFEFLGICLSKTHSLIPNEAITEFKTRFEQEILNKRTISQFSLKKLIEVFKNFAGGWSNYYQTLCPEDYSKVQGEMDQYLMHYIESKKRRKKFFGDLRLKLQKPFIKLAETF